MREREELLDKLIKETGETPYQIVRDGKTYKVDPDGNLTLVESDEKNKGKSS